MNDSVNHPAHYTGHPSGVECITITEHMGFCLGNAIKYIWRADLKGKDVEDLEKARWYIDREIQRRKGHAATANTWRARLRARLEREYLDSKEPEVSVALMEALNILAQPHKSDGERLCAIQKLLTAHKDACPRSWELLT